MLAVHHSLDWLAHWALLIFSCGNNKAGSPSTRSALSVPELLCWVPRQKYIILATRCGVSYPFITFVRLSHCLIEGLPFFCPSTGTAKQRLTTPALAPSISALRSLLPFLRLDRSFPLHLAVDVRQARINPGRRSVRSRPLTVTPPRTLHLPAFAPVHLWLPCPCLRCTVAADPLAWSFF